MMRRTYSFVDVPTRQETKVGVFKDCSKPTIRQLVKIQGAIENMMHVLFFRSTGIAIALKLEWQTKVTTNCYTI